ncbi:MAG: hypothetical protein FWE28_07970 [Oscillospiraceae bacterium]|nr:hypothetical protein [Oscillospiraceae bacterium]
MTFVNWISIGVAAVIGITGLVVHLYYRKKLRNLEGFMGITTPEDDDL